MFKKTLLPLFILALLLVAAPKEIRAAEASTAFDTGSLDKGIVTVHYDKEDGNDAIVRIAKDKDKFDYPLVDGAAYPLQLGDGEYSLLVAVKTGGNKYKVVAQENVTLSMSREFDVFLQSISLIRFTPETKAVAEARNRITDSMSDLDKVTAVYSFITQTYQYDHEKATRVEPGYIPDLDTVFDESKGICYDYAATFAAMARSAGIPTRMVLGYEASAPDTYHAWNQVLLDGKWETVDTTYDAVRVQNGEETPLFKSAENYTITKFY